MALHWNDPALLWPKDDPLTARHRRHQSWYRQEVLGAPYGGVMRGRFTPVGSMLDRDAVRRGEASNFLDEATAAYARRRIPVVRAQNGSLEVGRLLHNMLSSMPMCFNLFGGLRPRLELADLLNALLDLDIALIETCECEWRPRSNPLGDRTAFDCFISYVRTDGTRGLLGIETKYTEPFSTTVYGNREPHASRYRATADACGWFRADAHRALADRPTDQLWRVSLLAAAMLCDDHHWDDAHVVVVHLADDGRASEAVDRVRGQMVEPDRVCSLTAEQIVDTARTMTPLKVWADSFAQRYTSPVA